MKFLNSFLILCISGFACYLDAAISSDSMALSVINNSGDTVEISYSRVAKGPRLKKLLEQGEALTFGVVNEAFLSSIGIISKYTTPAPALFFSQKSVKQSKHCTVILEGTKHRTLTNPFGEWNIKNIIDQSPEELFPHVAIPQQDMIIKAFPTTVRKNIPTPRFILGLPDNATLEDAIDAENLLSQKWLAIKTTNSKEAQSITAILRALNNARKAFELGKPDELVSELTGPSPYSIALAD